MQKLVDKTIVKVRKTDINHLFSAFHADDSTNDVEIAPWSASDYARGSPADHTRNRVTTNS